MFQISLRSLLVLVAMVALAIVSLRFATTGWCTLVLSFAMIAFWLAAIVAVVDRGKRQAFAIGFALSMGIYGIVLAAVPLVGNPNFKLHPEFNSDTGRLPTTRVLGRLYRTVVEVRWWNMGTGQEAPGYDPTVQGAAPRAAMMTMSASPNEKTFMTIGHCWWALLLGGLGGWFARFVYLRRMREQETLAAGRS